ncbi:alkaline phosphatase family protein [soil metagenome]
MPAPRILAATTGFILLAASAAAVALATAVRSSAMTAAVEVTPIEHVVIIYMENHSFNNVLGYLCVFDKRCDGTKTGKTSNGSIIPIAKGEDIIPIVDHSRPAQERAINGGAMNGFDLVAGCEAANGYKCYQGYQPYQIPNLAALARSFVISDRTFQLDSVASWAAHMELVTTHLNNYYGKNPYTGQVPPGPGWGCDSFKDTGWRASPSDPYKPQPACIPKPDGSGPYRPSPVQWTPTIMDRLDEAAVSWKIYATQKGQGQCYCWSICPTFAECVYGPQISNFVGQGAFVTHARAGTLPAFSILKPPADASQHNTDSMQQGDNWIGDMLDEVMTGPDWTSTAVFITYDDCGCFYDHVTPPAGLSIRVPMVIVSPYAKPGYTDSNVASFASMLAFTERVFGVEPVGTRDANAYDYWESFDFTQAPLAPIPMRQVPLPAWEVEWLAEHKADYEDAE